MFPNDTLVIGKGENEVVGAEPAAKSYAAPQLVVIGQARDLLQGGVTGDAFDYVADWVCWDVR